jgi:hypothetical protein
MGRAAALGARRAARAALAFIAARRRLRAAATSRPRDAAGGPAAASPNLALALVVLPGLATAVLGLALL